jgi:hypothetical protein
MTARYLTGIEEFELRRRTDLSEDTLRALATLDHAREVYRRASIRFKHTARLSLSSRRHSGPAWRGRSRPGVAGRGESRQGSARQGKGSV